ncbi:DUF1351 domain-containing protein [Lactococcus allomyrinae]|uniref:DUF1351 domain-containing protein n=1 Tax=Lactococcus allomyrinae TaxID=2419773 RepID=A0A387BMP2_9LACT|nr:DUF1351 domain-containing protein [Lactococcus allomyrinae]AYF99800.1 DUF1351 domain-containing protein [Lactococcus allomyrinae]
MNELSVKFIPASIELVQQKEFEQQIIDIANKYSNLVVTQETLKESRETRAELNGVIKDLESKRKQVKAHINEPYEAFAGWLKQATLSLTDTISKIDAGIKECERNTRELRLQILTANLEKICEDKELQINGKVMDSRIFDAELSKMALAVNFTKDMNLTKVAREKLQELVEVEFNAKKELALATDSINTVAFSVNLEPRPYLQLFVQGKPIAEVLVMIQKDAQAKDERRRLAEQIQIEKAEKAKQAELAKQEATRQAKVMSSAEPPHQKVIDPYPAQLIFSIDFETVAQKDFFKSVMEDNGFEYVVKSFESRNPEYLKVLEQKKAQENNSVA